MNGSERVGRAAIAGYVAAVAAVVGLVTIGLFFRFGQPFGTLNDVSLLVITLALAPVMLGFYELGGPTPLVLARIALATGIGSVAAWSIVQASLIVGLVTFDYQHAATGWFAVEAVAQIMIGAWIAGANALAGPWLGSITRWLGVITGLGFIGLAIGLLLGGMDNPLTYVGGIGYQGVLPI